MSEDIPKNLKKCLMCKGSIGEGKRFIFKNGVICYACYIGAKPLEILEVIRSGD